MGGRRAALAVAAVGAIVLTAAGCSSNRKGDCVEAAAPVKADTGIVLAKGKSGGHSSGGSGGSSGSKGSSGSGGSGSRKGSGTSPHTGGGGTRVVHHYHHRPGSTRSDDYIDECGNPSPAPGSGFGDFGGDCATPNALPAATPVTGSPSASPGGVAPSSAAPPVPCTSRPALPAPTASPSALPSPSPSASRSGTR
ncbi:hypothetical protein ACIQF6_07640 [Kitasatospora sp. NPDC092948]|uniref:hypothetical protein n=1 Tax=Kitasatospora sp. NPDC092948 TaxID=3364088 RepID=UPI00380B7506